MNMEIELREQEIKTLVSDLRDKVNCEKLDSIESLKNTIFEIDRTRWLMEKYSNTMSTELCILQNMRQQVHKNLIKKEQEEYQNNKTIIDLKEKINIYLNYLEKSCYDSICGESCFKNHQEEITRLISETMKYINTLKMYGTKELQPMGRIQLLQDIKVYSRKLDEDFKRILGISE